MHENSSLAYTLNCITLAGIFAISLIISKKTSDNVRTFLSINQRGYALIFLVIVVDFFLSSVSDLLFFVNLNQKGRYLLILAIFVMIAMSIVLLILYFRLKHYHYALQQTNSINLKMLQMEERHYKELQKKNADLRAFRHDYNYHITAMQGLSQKKDLTELKKYVESLIAVKEQVYYFSTNHPVADAIINSIYENIPENTDFHVDGKFPETIFVNNSDLCIVLSNLLKNAVEAASRLSAVQKKQIYLSFFGNDDYIIIRIENTSEQQPSHRITSKPDSINHGFGLKNVRDAVNRYGGKLDLKYSHGIFTASAYMRNTSAVKV
jgi:signal transduction histidine kinase